MYVKYPAIFKTIGEIFNLMYEPLFSTRILNDS